MLLALAIAVSFGLGSPTPTPSPPAGPVSLLPTTVPGLSTAEGVFLVSVGDDGSPAIYFIAQDTRHSILLRDMRLEQALNPLWPVQTVGRDVVLAFAEAAPVGAARVGLLDVAAAQDAPAETPAAVDPLPARFESTLSYTVRAGDNLTDLGALNNTTVQAIVDASGMGNPNLIYVGQTITIPLPSAAPAPDEAVDAAEQAFLGELAAAPLTYTVKHGESAISISRQFGVDVETLLVTNGVRQRDHIETGQVLTIPAAEPAAQSFLAG